MVLLRFVVVPDDLLAPSGLDPVAINEYKHRPIGFLARLIERI